MAIYKALKHKVLVHTYGHFMKDFQDEIFYSEIPRLFPNSMTMDKLRDIMDECPNVLKKLEEYKLIDIEVKQIE